MKGLKMGFFRQFFKNTLLNLFLTIQQIGTNFSVDIEGKKVIEDAKPDFAFVVLKVEFENGDQELGLFYLNNKAKNNPILSLFELALNPAPATDFATAIDTNGKVNLYINGDGFMEVQNKFTSNIVKAEIAGIGHKFTF